MSKYQTTSISFCILKPGYFQSTCSGSSSFSRQLGLFTINWPQNTHNEVCRKVLLDMKYFVIILPNFLNHFWRMNHITYIPVRFVLRNLDNLFNIVYIYSLFHVRVSPMYIIIHMSYSNHKALQWIFEIPCFTYSSPCVFVNKLTPKYLHVITIYILY